MTCVCGLGTSTDECCGPLLKGERKPETAEALMRSRYAAYALQEIDYIVATHDPEGPEKVDRESVAKWAKEATWEGLEIVATEAGAGGDDRGMVEFIAHYSAEGHSIAHHERSQFRKVGDQWLYHDGEMVKAGTVLCILEAMKMENEIRAAKDGVVTNIRVTEGSTVNRDDLLMQVC